MSTIYSHSPSLTEGLLRFANGFPRLGFVFLSFTRLYHIFISRVKIAKQMSERQTGSGQDGWQERVRKWRTTTPLLYLCFR